MADFTGNVALIDSNVKAAQDRVDAAVAAAISDTSSFLDEIRSSMEFSLPFVEWTFSPLKLPDIDITADEPDRPDLDAEINSALSGIDKPNSPALSDVAVPAPPNISDFTDAMPNLNLPDIPDPQFPTVPPSPSIAQVAVPTRPQFSLPTAPSIQQIEIPPPPSVQLPEFTHEMPINDLIPPVNTFTYTERDYLSSLLDAVKTKLQDTITTGGTGLGVEIETAQIERQQERDAKLNREAIDNLVSEYSGKGFDLPTGALLAATRKILSDFEDRKLDQSRDILIEHAKLALENYRLALASGIQVEQILIAHHDAVAERALNVQKAVADIAINIFNAEVNNYNAKLRTAEVAATIYEIKIKAILQQLEYYRLQIESAKVTAEVQALYVDLYKASLEGLNALLGLYKTDMEAANLAAGIQKMKIDIFGKQIDAFSSQIGAEAAKYQAYRAMSDGQLAKATAFEAKARGYAAYVEGKKALSSVQIASLDAELRTNEQLIKKYEADIALYRAAYANAMERVGAAAKMFAADADIYRSDLSRAEAEARLVVEESAITARNIEANRRMLLENAKNNLNAFISAAALKAETARGGAQVTVNKLTALLNSISTVVQLAATGTATQNVT